MCIRDSLITIQGPADGIVNNGVMKFRVIDGVTISSVIGSGCIWLEQASDSTYDLSKPFNQTLYTEDGISYLHFIGQQLPESIPVIRANWLSKNDIEVAIGAGPESNAVPDLFYTNATGMLNVTFSTGSYLFDVGPGFSLTDFVATVCPSTTTSVDFPCVLITSSMDSEVPSSCCLLYTSRCV